jgi:drug/metabolite transporter (DMT)-like permease
MDARHVFPTLSLRMMRTASALLVLASAVLLVSPLSFIRSISPDNIPLHGLTFYGVTVGAYGLLPFVRRGDIAIVAMWVVLGVGVAPCFVGQELSAQDMFADMAGVVLGAAPIYIARFRQVAQGDVRQFRRRQAEDGA